MKYFSIFLPEGSVVNLKSETYDGLLCEIDNFFDIFKENVSYYAGYDDESIIEELTEQEINFEVM